MYSAGAEKVYDFIHTYIQSHQQLSPSIREIAAGCHMSSTTAAYYVRILQAQGRIKSEYRKARSIRLIDSKSFERK